MERYAKFSIVYLIMASFMLVLGGFGFYFILHTTLPVDEITTIALAAFFTFFFGLAAIYVTVEAFMT